MRIDIAAYRELPREIRVLIDEAAWAEFEQYAIVRETEWSTPDWTFLCFEDDALVAYFNLVDRVVRIDGEPVRVAGLNNMVTLPAHRGKGHASRLLRAAQPKWFRELGFQAGLLLCADSLLPFYSRIGWRKVECPVSYAQPDGSRTWSENAMLLGGEGRLIAKLQLDLCGLPW